MFVCVCVCVCVPPSPSSNTIFSKSDSRKLIIYCDLKGNFFLHFLGVVAVGYINEAIDEGDALKTLDSLLLPTAKIKDIDPDSAQHYQDVLYHAKSQKFLVSLSRCVSFKCTDHVGEGGGEEGFVFCFFNPFFLMLISSLSMYESV